MLVLAFPPIQANQNQIIQRGENQLHVWVDTCAFLPSHPDSIGIQPDSWSSELSILPGVSCVLSQKFPIFLYSHIFYENIVSCCSFTLLNQLYTKSLALKPIHCSFLKVLPQKKETRPSSSRSSSSSVPSEPRHLVSIGM